MTVVTTNVVTTNVVTTSKAALVITLILFVLCSDGKTYGACYGDSGGPLVVKQPHGFVLVGVAHFAATPNCKILPSGYYRVEPFLDWIQNTIKG